MAEEKPTPEGQAGTQVAEPEVLELTAEEFERKIDTDPKFATDYLNGNLEVEHIQPPEADAPKVDGAKAAPAVKAPDAQSAPQTPDKGQKQDPVATPTDDGKFQVDFDDGRKPLIYKSKNEAIKAIREKENFITRQREQINQLRERESAQADQIAKLKQSTPQTSPAAAASAQKPQEKPVEKAEEILDPFDPDYQKKLADKVKAQDEKLRLMEEDRQKDKEERRQEKEEAEKKDVERKSRETADQQLKSQYSEANSFVSRHSEFGLTKPVDVIDREYQNFLNELGSLAGTDGTPRQNLAVMDVFMDEVSESGKKLRTEAEKIGLRAPENLDGYFKVLHVAEQRRKLNKFDDVTGKMMPFTMEETYKYLQMQEGVATAPAAAAPPVPSQEKKDAPLAPRAQAIEAAAEHASRVAKDVPPGQSGQPIDISQMSQSQIGDIIDLPLNVVRKDAGKRALWEAAFKYLGMTPPRLDG